MNLISLISERRWRRSAARIFLSTFLFVLTLMALIFYVQYKSSEEYLKESQFDEIQELSRNIIKNIDETSSDILFLSQQNDLNDYIELPYQYYLDKISNEYYQFSKLKTKYFQMRLIGVDGNELVKVIFDGEAEIIPRNQLKNQADQEFFQEILSLEEGEIYISPFKLHTTDGEVNKPHQPSLLFGTPIFNSQGELSVMIVLNYSGERIFQSLQSGNPNSSSEKYLVNPQGYWLQGPDDALEWGFMFEQGQNWTVSAIYPQVWEILQTNNKGQYIDSNGLFTFKKSTPFTPMIPEMNDAKAEVNVPGIEQETSVVPSIEQEQQPPAPRNPISFKFSGNDYHWYLLSFYPDFQKGLIKSLLPGYLVILLIVAISLSIITWLVAYNDFMREESRIALKEMATHDSLTRLPNRLLFLDRLNHAVAIAKRNNNQLAILFIDLDDFKSINDTYGHHIGDIVLVEVARRLQDSVRESDTVGRFAGDEFICLLENITNPDSISEIAQKILDTLNQEYTIAGCCTLHFSASIGISISPQDSEAPDELVHFADVAMYAIKAGKKNNFGFYTSEANQ